MAKKKAAPKLTARHPGAEEIALLAALRANPGDDTPKLVYADWLQENGDEAHAGYIRLWIAEQRATANWEAEKITKRYDDTYKKFQRRIGVDPNLLQQTPRELRGLNPEQYTAYSEWLVWMSEYERKSPILREYQAIQKEKDIFIQAQAQKGWMILPDTLLPPECRALSQSTTKDGFITNLEIYETPTKNSLASENFWRGILKSACIYNAKNSQAMQDLVTMPGYHSPAQYSLRHCPTATVAAIGEPLETKKLTELDIEADFQETFLQPGGAYTADILQAVAAQPHFQGLQKLRVMFKPVDPREVFSEERIAQRIDNFDAINRGALEAFAVCPHLQGLTQLHLPPRHAQVLACFLRDHPEYMKQLKRVGLMDIPGRQNIPDLPDH